MINIVLQYICMYNCPFYAIINHDRLFVGVTIVAKYDYCDTVDIAGSTIAILLLLWTTIAILLSETFMLV